LIGRWLPCELDPHHRRVSDAVKISTPLFERFVSDERDVFFAENFHTPETTWLLDVADPHEPGNCFSVFPEDYQLTPVAADPLLFAGKLPKDEKCLDPITGEVVEASTFWSGETQFIRSVNGQMEELPGIEFRPDGSLACIWTRELEVRFAFASRSHQDYVVLIDTATGFARIDQAEVR
jgi:hypothetical protein